MQNRQTPSPMPVHKYRPFHEQIAVRDTGPTLVRR